MVTLHAKVIATSKVTFSRGITRIFLKRGFCRTDKTKFRSHGVSGNLSGRTTSIAPWIKVQIRETIGHWKSTAKVETGPFTVLRAIGQYTFH